MINVLIADDNVYYATTLMNLLNKTNENIKVRYITKNGKETIDILNSDKEIDVIILDLKMPIYNGVEILDMIKDKEKYRDSCIVMSSETDLIKMIKNNDIVHCIINKIVGINEIVTNIEELMKNKENIIDRKNIKNRIIEELLYLGFDISLKGTKYLISAIEFIALKPDKKIQSLEKDVYPVLSYKYVEPIHNIKCNINRAITSMYYECEVEKMKNYFCFSKDIKPNVKTIINTIINKIFM